MILVLLPIRNAANDLSGYFHSVGRFADGVLALDDGSIDETPELLRQHPLVKGVLHNPPREGFAGWDDAANRNRLLTAAADFSPEWILSLDADERIDEEDARSLQVFTQTDAVPGLAYGFRCYPTSDDGLWHLPFPIWIYRLFHFSPGQRFPDSRFHFAPIPTEIPREAYLRTSFRIQHLGGFDNARRAARYEKYRDVDPDRRFWPSYSALLAPVDDELLIPWQPRSETEPALLWDEPASATPSAQFSRAVIVVDDAGRDEDVAMTLEALRQASNDPFEIIVASSSGTSYEGVITAECRPGATRGERLQRAFDATSADLLIVLDAGQVVEPRDRDALWRALADGYGVVRCAIIASGQSRGEQQVTWLRSNWPEEPGELGSWRPVGYRRDALDELGTIPVPAMLDHDVEAYLVRLLGRKGVLVGRVPAVVADRAPGAGELSLASGFRRGRSWAGIDLSLSGPHPIPARTRAGRLLEHLRSGNSDVPKAVLTASALGYVSRLVNGRAGEGWAIAGWPARTLAFAGFGPDGNPWCSIGRFDFISGSVTLVNLPDAIEIPPPDAVNQAAAHRLRDQLELLVNAPIDDAVLCSPGSGVQSIDELQSFASRWRNLRSEIASTMTPVQQLAVVLRLATLPEPAIAVVELDPGQPVGPTVIAALKLDTASSMRDRLRNVSWA